MSYNQALFEITRSQDVELAEDLNRRINGNLASVQDVNTFVSNILNQYPPEWAKPSIMAGPRTTFETWCKAYRGSVLPFLMANRLPPAPNGCRPVYPL